jgi:tetratricopeptide (TPR) repeat protein
MKSCLTIITLIFGLNFQLVAQSTSTTTPTETPSGSGGTMVPTKFLESESLLNLSNNVFNTESDAIDFENGSFLWKGKTFSLDQNYLFKSRFERYLSTPVDETDYEPFRELFNRIKGMLSLNNDNLDEETMQEAWKLLFDLAEFDSDGGNSQIIASQVHNAWRVRNEKKNIEVGIAELERQRILQERIVVNRMDVIENNLRVPRMRGGEAQQDTTAGGRGTGTIPNTTQDTGSSNQDESSTEENSRSSSVSTAPQFGGLDMAMNSASSVATPQMDNDYTPIKGKLSEPAFRLRDLARTETEINVLNLKGYQSAIQAKLQFQSQILGFFMQRRFEHVLIASQFYRKIFKGSSQKLDVGHKELAQFFPNTDMTYTIDMLAQVSQEAINDVNNSMKSIESSYELGDRIVALKRLQETFFLGEFVPSVYLFDDTKKKVLLDIYRLMKEAKDLFDVKDYLEAEKAIHEIEELAEDFSSRQVLSAMNSAKNLSNYSISAAYQYREMGQPDKVTEQLTKAIEIWPSNPKIQEFQESTNQLLSKTVQGTTDFDDLLKQQSFRAIFERRNELGLSIGNDTARLTQLDEIVKKIATVDFLLNQCEEMVAQKNPYGAWEVLENAIKLEPNDNKINKMRANLALQVGDFVQKLDLAQRQEKENLLSPSLTNFMAAQDIYPASQTSRLAIERVSALILEKISQNRSEITSETDPMDLN